MKQYVNRQSRICLCIALLFLYFMPLAAASLFERRVEKESRTRIEGAIDADAFWELVRTGKEVKPELSKSDKKVVLVLGNTGAGKSTTINYLLGHEMQGKKKRKRTVLMEVSVAQKDQKKGPEIGGEGTASCTTCCKIYSKPEDTFCYIDTPGSIDTRCIERWIYNSIQRKIFIDAVGQVHAILIIASDHEWTASKGRAVYNLLRAIKESIKDFDDAYMPHIFFGLTKIEIKDLNSDYLIEDFRKEMNENPEERPAAAVSDSQMMMEKLLTEEGNVYPIYPLDGGTSRNALCTAMKEKAAKGIAATQFKLGMAGRDIEECLLELFATHPIVQAQRIRTAWLKSQKLKKDIEFLSALLTSHDREDQNARKLILTKYKVRINEWIAEKNQQIEALLLPMKRKWRNLDLVILHRRVYSTPRSVRASIFSTTMSFIYKGPPFSETASKVTFNSSVDHLKRFCSVKEVSCNAKEGEWVVDVHIPSLIYWPLGPLGLALLIVGALHLKVERQQATKPGRKENELEEENRELAPQIVYQEEEEENEFEEELEDREVKPLLKILGLFLYLAKALIIASISFILLGNKSQYTPQLEVWCKVKDIHAMEIEEIRKKEEVLQARITELQSGSIGIVEQKLQQSITAFDSALQELKEQILKDTFVLQFIEEVLPLLDPDKVKKFPSIAQSLEDFKKYKFILEPEGAFWQEVENAIEAIKKPL